MAKRHICLVVHNTKPTGALGYAAAKTTIIFAGETRFVATLRPSESFLERVWKSDTTLCACFVFNHLTFLTDEQFFWGVVNSAGVAMGFKDLNTKFHLPALLMLAVGYICNVIGWILSRKLRVSPFTVSLAMIHIL